MCVLRPGLPLFRRVSKYNPRDYDPTECHGHDVICPELGFQMFHSLSTVINFIVNISKSRACGNMIRNNASYF